MAITNNFLRPSGTVFIKTTARTRVGGKSVKVGEIIEVSADDAGLIVSANRGKFVDGPEPKKK